MAATLTISWLLLLFLVLGILGPASPTHAPRATLALPHSVDLGGSSSAPRPALPRSGDVFVQVLVVPTSACGSAQVQIGANSYGNGSIVDVGLPGTSASLVIPPSGFCSGFYIDSVKVSSGITISYPSASLPAITYSATLNVNLNGTLAVQFQVPVAVGWSPSACGPLIFNGTQMGNTSGSSGTLVFPGTYQSTLSCSGHTFEGWSVRGAITVLTPSSATSQVTVGTGGGELWENFSTSGSPPSGLQQYTVGLQVVPTSCGPLQFNGGSYPSGSSETVHAGSYTVTAPTCSGYSFTSWSATGGLTPSAPTSATTSVLVQGNGTLTVTYQSIPPPSGGAPPVGGSNGPSLLSGASLILIVLVLVVVVAVVAALLYVRSRRPGAPLARASQTGIATSGAYPNIAPMAGPSPSVPPPQGSSGPGPSPVAPRPGIAPGRTAPPSFAPRPAFVARPATMWRPQPLAVYETAEESSLWEVVRTARLSPEKLLCFTRLTPQELSSRFGLAGAKIVRISRVEAEDAVPPSDLEKIAYLIERHLTARGCAVVLPGLESLVEASSLKGVGRLLEVAREVAQASQGAVLVSLNPRALAETQTALLERGATRL